MGVPASEISKRVWPTRDMLGVPLHALTMEQVLAVVDQAVIRRQRLMIGVVNAAKLVNMRRDRSLHDSVVQSDIILADGMSVVWASRLLRKALPERVPGIDLMFGILQRGMTASYRIYCLGATQEALDVVIERIGSDFPGVVLAGHHHGYFGSDDEERIAHDIRDSRADVLLVAMTSPKKELFLARWGSLIDVPVCHGVGGSFDVMAGKTKRAPRLWQKIGMEWFYRVLQEPRRLWRRYLVTNTLFCGMVMRELVTGSRSSTP